MIQTTNKMFLSIDLDDWYLTPAITGSSFAKYITVNDFFNDCKEPFDYTENYKLIYC